MLVTFQFVCNQVSNNYNWWFVCLYLLHVLWMLLDPACFSLSIFGVVDHVFIYKWRMLLQIIPFCFCWFTCSTASTSWNFQIGCCCLMVENFDNICVQLKRIIFVLLKVLIVFLARKNSTAGNFIVRYNGRQKKKASVDGNHCNITLRYICYSVLYIVTTCLLYIQTVFQNHFLCIFIIALHDNLRKEMARNLFYWH